MKQKQTICCVAVLLLALSCFTAPAQAALAYVTGVEPTTTSGTATPYFEILPGATLNVAIQAYKFGVTDGAGRGGNVQCFLRTFKVDDFGGARTEQTDLEMTYSGDAGSGSPPSNDRYIYSFRGADKQKYEYTLYCRDVTDNAVATPNMAEFVSGQVIFYGIRTGDVVWMNEDFSSFTGRGFDSPSNLTVGQLNSDNWRVGGLISMDFGTTRTGGAFARGETLQISNPGIYGIKVSETNHCLLAQPSYDPSERILDPGFIELRLENNLENNINPASNHSIRVQYGWYGYGNTARMQTQLMYRVSSSKSSVSDSAQYTPLGSAVTFNLVSAQSNMQTFDFNIAASVPSRSYIFFRWAFQSEGTVTGIPDAVGLFMTKVTVAFGGSTPAINTTVPSSSVANSNTPASASGVASSAQPSASAAPSGSVSRPASVSASRSATVSASAVSRSASASAAASATSTVRASSNGDNVDQGSAASATTVTLTTLLLALVAHALKAF